MSYDGLKETMGLILLIWGVYDIHILIFLPYSMISGLCNDT